MYSSFAASWLCLKLMVFVKYDLQRLEFLCIARAKMK